jgi:hypothetical protein
MRAFTFGACCQANTAQYKSLQNAVLYVDQTKTIQKWYGVPERFWANCAFGGRKNGALPLCVITAIGKNNSKSVGTPNGSLFFLGDGGGFLTRPGGNTWRSPGPWPARRPARLARIAPLVRAFALPSPPARCCLEAQRPPCVPPGTAVGLLARRRGEWRAWHFGVALGPARRIAGARPECPACPAILGIEAGLAMNVLLRWPRMCCFAIYGWAGVTRGYSAAGSQRRRNNQHSPAIHQPEC